jgi:CBS domain containing-hemolysin-like protein
MVTLVLLRVFAVILLVAANAFFVAAEFALVALRETRIQQLIDMRRIGARTVQKLHRNLDEVLNAVQFGITMASLALGWIGEPTLAAMLLPVFEGIPYAAVYAHAIAITIAFAIITYLHVILGEVVPKTLALQRAEHVALAVATPMDFFMTVFRPFLYIMNNSSRLVLRAFGTKPMKEGGVHSPEELKMIVTASRLVGLLPRLQEDMIHRALEVENVTVREIMVPRTRVFSLPANMPLEDAMARVVEEQHSRIPVYDPARGPEFIVGTLYSKDLTRTMYQKMRGTAAPGGPSQVQHIMRDVLVVPETKPVLDLLVDFKQRRRHLAVVVDEFGSTVGVVTVEDVLEQIVGEIEDEFDIAEQIDLPLGVTRMELAGSENLRDLELHHGIVLPREEGFSTLAGFVLWQLQKIPQGGESFEYDGRRYTVLAVDGMRVTQVRIEQLHSAQTVTAGD